MGSVCSYEHMCRYCSSIQIHIFRSSVQLIFCSERTALSPCQWENSAGILTGSCHGNRRLLPNSALIGWAGKHIVSDSIFSFTVRKALAQKNKKTKNGVIFKSWSNVHMTEQMRCVTKGMSSAGMIQWCNCCIYYTTGTSVPSTMNGCSRGSVNTVKLSKWWLTQVSQCRLIYNPVIGIKPQQGRKEATASALAMIYCSVTHWASHKSHAACVTAGCTYMQLISGWNIQNSYTTGNVTALGADFRPIQTSEWPGLAAFRGASQCQLCLHEEWLKIHLS